MIRLHDEPLPDLPGVPASVTNVLRHGMASDPEQRYPTAAAFRDALASVSLDPETVTQGPAPSPQGPTSAPPHQVSGPPGAPPAGNGSPWARPAYGQAPVAPYGGQSTPGGQVPPGGRPPPGVYPPAAGPGGSPPKKPSRGRTAVVASAITLVALLLVGGASMVAYQLVDKPATEQARDRSPSPSPSPAPSPSSSDALGDLFPSLPLPTSTDGSDIGSLFGDCPLETVGSAGGVDVRCPGKPECFAGINNIGGEVSARKLSCDRKHTWETFLIGKLPSTVKSAEYEEVAGNAVVKTLCGGSALTLALKGESTSGWSSEILPPSESDFEDGNREFRCVAGKGLDKLNKPQFAAD
jgi:hypothetical protein